MQGLVFIYDKKRSVKNRMLTVRLEERKKTGKLWVPAGPKRVYTARDLQRPGLRIIDKKLFSMAFKSETDVRQLEGRFFSSDQEYTLFRISPYDLKAFFDGSVRSKVLCQQDGSPVRFKYVGMTVPKIVFTDSGNGFVPTVYLGGRKLDDPSYEMISNPVRVMSSMQVYELPRDLPKEDTFQNQLKTCGVIYRPENRSKWFIPEGKREQILYTLQKNGYRIMLEGIPLKLDIGIAWDIRVTDDILCVGGAVQYKKGSTDMESILNAYLESQRWFELPDGGAGYIPESLTQELRLLEQRGDFGDDDIRFAAYDFSFVAEIFREKKNVIRDKAFDEYLSLLQDIAHDRHQIEIPKSLKAELRPYQKTGFRWLAGLCKFGFGGVLADDMGLGKTIQVLALLLYLKEKSTAPHLTLLIVPKTLIWNWQSEIKKFAPSLGIKVHTGPGRDKSFADLSGVDMVITSYGIVRQDITFLERVSWDHLVLDEAQAIKNPTAKISISVRSLKSSVRLAVTGTPIENRPLDLWSLFDFLMPDFLGDKDSFQQIYEQQNENALNTLGVLTAPFILRRMKKQVCKELPVKTEITMRCDFSEEQKACYDDILMNGKRRLSGTDAFSGKLPSGQRPSGQLPSGSQSIQILTLLLRLRQAACHQSLVPGTEPFIGSSGKFDAILETALEILDGGYKILIFSQFVALLELVKEMFEEHGIEQHTLYGSTRQRKEVIDRFKGSQNPCVFLISLKTGGVGLNLTEAGYVFLLDPWWNPAIENQAIDRSHRIGQQNPVTVYRFLTKDSVEENVNRLKERKQQIEKAVLQHGDIQDIPLSENELLELIG